MLDQAMEYIRFLEGRLVQRLSENGALDLEQLYDQFARENSE